jgi:UDP-glucose 4-epimerase
MKTIVLGASGYVGGIVSSFLQARGHQVAVQMRTKPAVEPEWPDRFDKVFLGDPTDAKVQNKIATENFDAAVFPIAMDYQNTAIPFQQVLAVNVGLVWEYLTLLHQKIGAFIYFSTSNVYGPFGPGLTEDRECKPTDVNALTHLMAERVGEYFGRKRTAAVYNLRLTNVYGAPAFLDRKFLRFAVNDFCYQAISKEKIQLKGDGTALRDFIYAGDVASVVEVLSKRPCESSTFNLGAGKSYSIRELTAQIQAFSKDRGQNVDVVGADGSALPQPADTKGFSFDVSRLSALGYRAKGTLTGGIQETFGFVHRLTKS